MSTAIKEAIADLERQVEQETQMALHLLYGTGRYEEDFSALMTAALAHSNCAIIRQKQLEALRGS